MVSTCGFSRELVGTLLGTEMTLHLLDFPRPKRGSQRGCSTVESVLTSEVLYQLSYVGTARAESIGGSWPSTKARSLQANC